jgi:hypothetical protein
VSEELVTSIFTASQRKTPALILKLTVTELVKIFPAFCGILNFISVFITAAGVPYLNQMNQVHNFPPFP